MSEEENKIELEEADIDTTVTEEYSAKDIQVLEGLEAVRKRPGMYIGSTGPRGLHHLVYEIVDNSIDEALAGVCTHIECNILPGDIIEVKDNGRGIPTGINEKTGLPAVTVVLTVLHAGGKFGGSGYKVSGGLHGVGSSVVNALSEWLEVEVTQNGHIYSQKFERGKPVNDLHIIADHDGHGTTIRFKADSEIFQETTVYDYEILARRLREQAFLNAGLSITLTDKRGDEDNLSLNISIQAVDLILFRMRLSTFQQPRATEVQRLHFATPIHITKLFCLLPTILILLTAVLTKQVLKPPLREYLTTTAKNLVFLKTVIRSLAAKM